MARDEQNARQSKSAPIRNGRNSPSFGGAHPPNFLRLTSAPRADSVRNPPKEVPMRALQLLTLAMLATVARADFFFTGSASILGVGQSIVEHDDSSCNLFFA